MGEEQAKVGNLVRYSEAFKRKVVTELEGGKHQSIECARRAYGIKGSGTVAGWVRKYGREDLLPKIVRIETLKERDELKEARKRIRDLEAAVADAHIDYCLEKGFLQAACDRLGEDMESFKKKHAMTLSDTRKQRRGR
jgi:transposase-like protein